MKHLKAIANLIEQAGKGQQGIDLFIGTIPASVPAGIMLRDPLEGIELDRGMDGTYEGKVQLIVRHPDMEESYDRALEIAQILTLDYQQADDVFFVALTPMHLPISFPRGDSDEIESSVRFRALFGDAP